MKKQIYFAAVFFVCALAVIISGAASGDAQSSPSAVLPYNEVAAITSAALPPPPGDTDATFTPPSSRIYIFRGLPFAINKISLISIVQIVTMAIFIGLFIKPKDVRIEFLLDADGKK